MSNIRISRLRIIIILNQKYSCFKWKCIWGYAVKFVDTISGLQVNPALFTAYSYRLTSHLPSNLAISTQFRNSSIHIVDRRLHTSLLFCRCAFKSNFKWLSKQSISHCTLCVILHFTSSRSRHRRSVYRQ